MAARKRQPKPSVEAEAGPRLEVEYLAVEALTPYARNSRTHSDAQVAQIAASIREFGFTNPILIDDRGTIIAGHGRLMAAMRLGLAEVPTICLGHLTAEQRRAYVIADNRLALNAGWDMEMLAAEVRTIQNDIDGGLVEFGLDILGFDTPELAEMLDAMDGAGDGDAGDGGDAENETPAVQAVPISRPGEVWLLGAHRLICGDATDPKVVAAVFDGEKPALMVTDPPYGVEYDPAWRNEADGGSRKRTGKVVERRPGRLARGVGAVPRGRRLRLARGQVFRRGGR
jgi:hypothetical protein